MPTEYPIYAVTGAFGYTGKYIARRLLAEGCKVRTLTGHPHRTNPFGDALDVRGLAFDDLLALRDALKGVAVLYNTYWVRFDYGGTTFAKAVENSRRLFQAAREAGVERIVHVSIANPSYDSPFAYYRGKAAVEEALRVSGVGYAILRPTVGFGPEDILINNIAFLLRRFPAFTIAGGGDYGLQPVFVEDLATLAVEWGCKKENAVLDAVGPESFQFHELVLRIRRAIAARALVLRVAPAVQLFFARLLGRIVGDVVLTREELGGLMAGLLVSKQPPTCPTRFSDWLDRNAATLGRTYASELGRHYAG